MDGDVQSQVNIASVVVKTNNEFYSGCDGVGGKRKHRILANEKPNFLLVRMQRWIGMQKDNGEVEVPLSFEIRDVLDDSMKTSYTPVGVIHHIGNRCSSGHYVSQVKKGISFKMI